MNSHGSIILIPCLRSLYYNYNTFFANQQLLLLIASHLPDSLQITQHIAEASPPSPSIPKNPAPHGVRPLLGPVLEEPNDPEMHVPHGDWNIYIIYVSYKLEWQM